MESYAKCNIWQKTKFVLHLYPTKCYKLLNLISRFFYSKRGYNIERQSIIILILGNCMFYSSHIINIITIFAIGKFESKY